jgi:hypothetical protein
MPLFQLRHSFVFLHVLCIIKVFAPLPTFIFLSFFSLFPQFPFQPTFSLPIPQLFFIPPFFIIPDDTSLASPRTL